MIMYIYYEMKIYILEAKNMFNLVDFLLALIEFLIQFFSLG
jgi:hypothetical protein